MVLLALMSPGLEPEFYSGYCRSNEIVSSLSQRIHHDFGNINPLISSEIGGDFITFEDGSSIQIEFQSIKCHKHRVVDYTTAYTANYIAQIIKQEQPQENFQGFFQITCSIYRNNRIFKYSTTTCALTESEKEWLLTSLKYNLVNVFTKDDLEFITRLCATRKIRHIEFERIDK